MIPLVGPGTGQTVSAASILTGVVGTSLLDFFSDSQGTGFGWCSGQAIQAGARLA